MSLRWGHWAIFDRGHSDKLLFRQGWNGEYTQDVLFKHTPWVGGVPTEEDIIHLERRAEAVAMIDNTVTVEWKEGP